MECTAGQAHADAGLADDRLRAQGEALVSLGALSCLPHDAGGRSADLRSTRGRCVTGATTATCCHAIAKSTRIARTSSNSLRCESSTKLALNLTHFVTKRAELRIEVCLKRARNAAHYGAGPSIGACQPRLGGRTLRHGPGKVSGSASAASPGPIGLPRSAGPSVSADLLTPRTRLT